MQSPEQISSTRPSPSLTANQLKILASIAMFGDHAVKAWSIHGMTYTLLAQVLGRIAFPIYAFFIAEGFFHTRNRLKYLGRIALFAVLSEVPFDLVFHRTAWYPQYQNTLWALAVGLLLFLCMAKVESIPKLHIALSWILRLLLVAAFAVAAHYLRVDYRERGLLCMAVLYFLRKEQPRSVAVLWSCLPLNLNKFSNPGSFLAAIPLHFYHGEHGAANLKYFFYLYYPLHLLLILGIRHLI